MNSVTRQDDIVKLNSLSNGIIDNINQESKPKNKMDEILSQLEKGTQAIFETENYKEYLKVLSKFYNYSTNNIILIYSQIPYATKVASLTSWNKLGRSIYKGEHGIRIISPIISKPKTKENVEDETDLTEEQTPRGFKVSYVYDVSQTFGKDIPSITPNELLGNVIFFQDLKEIISEISPVPIRFDEVLGEAKGYYSHRDNEIVIKSNMSESQTIKTMIHEVAHSLLHSDNNLNKNRQTKEIEAESVAFVACSFLGIDTSDYSFKYLAGWSKDKETKELKQSLATIQDASEQIITQLESKIMDIDHIEIFQLDANSKNLFVGFDDLADPNINQQDYKCVYVGPLDVKSPDDIFSKFNISMPSNYDGHALSVSDVIVIHKNSEDRIYYVDSFGFKEIQNFKNNKEEIKSHENKKQKTR